MDDRPQGSKAGESGRLKSGCQVVSLIGLGPGGAIARRDRAERLGGSERAPLSDGGGRVRHALRPGGATEIDRGGTYFAGLWITRQTAVVRFDKTNQCRMEL